MLAPAVAALAIVVVTGSSSEEWARRAALARAEAPGSGGAWRSDSELASDVASSGPSIAAGHRVGPEAGAAADSERAAGVRGAPAGASWMEARAPSSGEAVSARGLAPEDAAGRRDASSSSSDRIVERELGVEADAEAAGDDRAAPPAVARVVPTGDDSPPGLTTRDRVASSDGKIVAGSGVGPEDRSASWGSRVAAGHRVGAEAGVASPDAKIVAGSGVGPEDRSASWGSRVAAGSGVGSEDRVASSDLVAADPERAAVAAASGEVVAAGHGFAADASVTADARAAADPIVTVEPSARAVARSRPRSSRRTLPPYQPRAIRELLALGSQRLAERQVDEEVRRILAMSDRRVMLARLDRLEIADADLLAFRGALRAADARCAEALADFSHVERLAPRSDASSYAARARRWCVASE